MIDIRKLKELVKLMVNNDLAEIDLRDPDEQVTLRRHGENVVVPQMAAPVLHSAPVAPVAGAETSVAQATAPVVAGEKIASPMVGTFYVAADPDSPAFIKVGDTVSEDTTVCIIEAMKIFNEIKAQCSGTVTQLLVENGEAVEFGQPLFIVTP
jgi:acetyl-CoA carboxylase biotin carboxyl carrier protein